MDDSDRLQRFRALVKSLDPTRPAGLAAADLYVERPDSVATRLGRRLQLDPTGAHLVVGAIGCGKTTELLQAGNMVAAAGDCQARYVDASKLQDLSTADELSVLVAVAHDVAKALVLEHPADDGAKKTHGFITSWADGYLDEYADHPDGLDDSDFQPGVVQRPSSDLPGRLPEFVPLLDDLRADVARLNGGALVLLIDGLDRVAEAAHFEGMVEPMLRSLRQVGIGVAIVGPWRATVGVDRVGTASFDDNVYEVSPVLPDSESGRRFLEQILTRRDPHGLLLARSHDSETPDRNIAIRRLVLSALLLASGGVPRDLLQLARAAVEEAWVRGADGVSAQDVAVAADRFGRSLVLGLRPDEIALLRKVDTTERFVPTTDEQRALIPTKRILEYRLPTGLPSYRVHPTIRPLLQNVHGAA